LLFLQLRWGLCEESNSYQVVAIGFVAYLRDPAVLRKKQNISKSHRYSSLEICHSFCPEPSATTNLDQIFQLNSGHVGQNSQDSFIIQRKICHYSGPMPKCPDALRRYNKLFLVCANGSVESASFVSHSQITEQ
jgi:hypothetical protein